MGLVGVRVRVRVRVRVGPGEPAFAVTDGAALVLQGVHDAVLDAEGGSRDAVAPHLPHLRYSVACVE